MPRCFPPKLKDDNQRQRYIGPAIAPQQTANSPRNSVTGAAADIGGKGRRFNATDRLMNEVVIYGGLPMRRSDVYRDALARTGSAKAADMFAFSQNTKLAPFGTAPLALKEYQKISPMRLTPRTRRLTPRTPRITPRPPRLTPRMRRLT